MPLSAHCFSTLATSLGAGGLLLGSAILAPLSSLAAPQPDSPPTVQVYAESPQPNQPSQGYLIFTEQGESLVGAFYYPQSEYSCFTGKRVGNTLKILALPHLNDPLTSFSVSLDSLEKRSTLGSAAAATLAACRPDVLAFLKQSQTAMETQPKALPQRATAGN
ncbi:hypothetical protein [Lyngbya confervoides]|uniref:Uncharacterized protein n=1 Tax=Lyngbya confervoides BDU141951 TaxID=1574623 RepID=A0ABD4T1P0_9CYAN|nr:hypothetical protein [Lyngbya confervoides]MCM1982520.1 hypothetical protein [Lyngbya confervoides BDU141951]